MVMVKIYLRQTLEVSSSLLSVNIEAFRILEISIPDYVNVVC